MQYQNVTLSLPKELLKKIKHIAIDKNISLSGLLSKTLLEIVQKEDEYTQAMEEHIKIMEKANIYQIGNSRWNRDELHE
jgi:hypothetical protein